MTAHRTLLLPFALLVALTGCEPRNLPQLAEDIQSSNTTEQTTSTQNTPKPTRERRKPRDPGKLEPDGYVQEAELRDLPGGVIDGDTIKAVGFSESLRLLNVNAEETFDRRADRAKAAQSWKAYVREQTRDEGFETFGTPMGEEAKEWARQFFKGIDKIWLEYQSPIRTHGFFGRHLVYAWVKKQGDQTGWINYNLEAVRAGMSPYYTKYGYSDEYHEEFLAAQKQAREAKRGIWAPGAKSYPDYDARIDWWNRRAEQLQMFRERFDDHPRYVDLGTDTAFAQLRRSLGERMVVFGEPETFKERGDPQRIRMSYRYRRDFTVVSFEPVELTDSPVNPDAEEFIYVEGVVGMYRGDPQLRYDEQSWMRSGANPPEADAAK